MRHLPALLLAAGLALGGVACQSEPEPTASPTTPTPTPTPTPTAEPVEGQAEIEIVDLAPTGVGGGVETPGVNQQAARRFGQAVTDWLDQHLTAVQGGSGLGGLEGNRLVRSAPAATVTAVTTALAAPTQLVDEASYAIRVAALGGPQWAQARVVVTDLDGNRHTADFMFEPSKAGPRVIAAGPADRTEPQPTATPDDGQGGDQS